jgi:hypothetical protein
MNDPGATRNCSSPYPGPSRTPYRIPIVAGKSPALLSN